MNIVCILNDEETFTDLAGSRAAVFNDANMELFTHGSGIARPTVTFDLSNPADLRRLADFLEAPDRLK